MDDKADILDPVLNWKFVATPVLVNYTVPGHKTGQENCHLLCEIVRLILYNNLTLVNGTVPGHIRACS